MSPCKLNRITSVYFCFGQGVWSSPVCFNPTVKLKSTAYLFIPPVLHQRHAVALLLWLWTSFPSLLRFCFLIQVVFAGNWRKIFAWHLDIQCYVEREGEILIELVSSEWHQRTWYVVKFCLTFWECLNYFMRFTRHNLVHNHTHDNHFTLLRKYLKLDSTSLHC